MKLGVFYHGKYRKQLSFTEMTNKKSTPIRSGKCTTVSFDLKAYVSTIKAAAPQAAFDFQSFSPRVTVVGPGVTNGLVDSAFQTAISIKKT